MKRWLIIALCLLVVCASTACARGKTPPANSQTGDVSTGAPVDNSKEETPNAGMFEDFDQSEDDASSTTDSTGGENGRVTDGGSTTGNTQGIGSDGSTTTAAVDDTTTAGGTTTTAPRDNVVDGSGMFAEDPAETDGTTTTTKATTVASAEQTKTGRMSLPAPGYDADGKGRIIIGEVSYDKPMVSIEIKNVATKWMTEETNYLEYTCYDKKGKVLTSKDALFGKLYMGALRAGKSVTKTFAVPDGTVRVEITGYSITYWTEWA